MQSASSNQQGRVMTIIVLAFVALVALVCGYFFYLSANSPRPTNLGKRPDGTLAECPNKPNSVSTFATDAEHKIEAIPYTDDPKIAWNRIVKLVQETPSAKIITQTDDYLHAEYTSRIFRFVDDVELVLDSGARKIHFRSASRVGHSDIGVNRGRMEDLRLRFLAAAATSALERLPGAIP